MKFNFSREQAITSHRINLGKDSTGDSYNIEVNRDLRHWFLLPGFIDDRRYTRFHNPGTVDIQVVRCLNKQG
jgi:hypothetical protein